MRVINVPIEPFEERYSNQWSKWFKEALDGENIPNIEVKPKPLTQGIEKGAFLDVIGTNYYKSVQMSVISTMIHQDILGQEGDIFLFHDLWFPGLEMLAYMREGLGLKFKIVGCLHAGSYDNNDYLCHKKMTPWAQYMENGWFQIADKIFVATEYHRRLVNDYREVSVPKVVVTGFPMYPKEFVTRKRKKIMDNKENIIVFPHRLDPEKNPHKFDGLKRVLKNAAAFKGWEFIRTKDVINSKDDYYDLLAKSKIAISYAKQETWGIAMQEAVHLGCLPLVPDMLSYREMYPDKFKYILNNESTLLHRMVVSPGEFEKALWKLQLKFMLEGKQAISNMIREICSL